MPRKVKVKIKVILNALEKISLNFNFSPQKRLA